MQPSSYNIIESDTQTEKELHICRYMRYVIAAIFIASGMMKGINIDGLSQSVSAYISLLGMTTKYAYALGGFLCIAEIAIGFSAMHYDIFRKLHWTYTVVMIFFTSITFLNMTSVYGGIESCGCFGELIHLNPAQSFYNNIVILMICMISSLHITFKSGREQIFTSTLFRKILKLIIGATLPIAFSIAFKNMPPYSPHLNIAETLWRFLKGQWIQPVDYASTDNLFYAVNRALGALGDTNFIDFSKRA